ncbi:unnamed protein product [Caenorhabditis angaria]|uniref:Uncharacterized protein n=1 Tax=Caenorhabditis angaria TaxID=860376 RepID=A0A9P1IT88_9PELO|nr:unnamed protein product [Caenorhabditis angaria]
MILELLLVVLGTFGHFLTLRNFQRRMVGYSRVILIVLSFAMTVNLNFGFFKNWTSSQILVMIFNYGFKFTQMLTFVLQLFFSFDRLLFIRSPRFYKTKLYFLIFFGVSIILIGISLGFVYTTLINGLPQKMNPLWLSFYISIIVLNLPLDLMAMKNSRDKYNQTTGFDLNERFNLAICYEMTRCFVFAAIFNILVQFILICIGFLVYSERVDLNMNDYRKISEIAFSYEMSIFPWIILVTNQKWRKKVRTMFSRRSNKVHVVNLKGQSLLTNPTQKDYFDQLEVAWNVYTP